MLVKLMIDYLYQLDYDDLLLKTDDARASAEAEGRFTWDLGLPPTDWKRREEAMTRHSAGENRLSRESLDMHSPCPEYEPAIMPGEESSVGHSNDEHDTMMQGPEPDEWMATPDWSLVTGNRNGIPPERIADDFDMLFYKDQNSVSEIQSAPSFWRGSRSTRPTKKSKRGKSSTITTTKELNAERLVVNANLYALADKYGINDLKLLAQGKFSTAAAQEWRREAFVHAADLVFKTTPSSDMGLRSVVINTLYQHQELTDYEEVQELLDSGNGIAWQLFKVLLSK